MLDLDRIFTFVTNSYTIIHSTKKESKMMKIFKKEDFNQLSNNYYNAYKANLEKKETKSKFLSLNNIIKLEFFTLVAGLAFMSFNHFFNHFSIEVKGDFFASSSMLLTQSNTFDREDASLMLELQDFEVDTLTNIEIKEENFDQSLVEEQVAILSEKLNISSTDMTLLVEIIKSQMHEPLKTVKEDKIIISQI